MKVWILSMKDNHSGRRVVLAAGKDREQVYNYVAEGFALSALDTWIKTDKQTIEDVSDPQHTFVLERGSWIK